MNSLIAFEKRMVRDFMSRAGECVRVSPCDRDTYEIKGHYWSEPITIFDGDENETLSDRHMIKFNMNDIEGRLSRGDEVVIRDMLFRIDKAVAFDGLTRTYQLHFADARLA